MKHQGYEATARYEEDRDGNKRLVAEAIDLENVIVEADCIADLEKKYATAVDKYLKKCEKEGVEPVKKFSGKMIVRVSPEMHRDVYVYSRKKGISLNWGFIELVEAGLKKSK